MALTLQDVFKQGNQALGAFKDGQGQLQGMQGMKGMSTSGRARGNGKVMRDEYGWSMTQDQYENIQGQEKKFYDEMDIYRADTDKEIEKARGTYNEQSGMHADQIAAAQGQLGTAQSALNDQRDSLDAAKDKLGSMPSIDKIFDDWYNKDKVKVNVWNNGVTVGTYMAPRTIVSGFHKGKEGAINALWNKGEYWIDQRQPKGYGGAQLAWDIVKSMTDYDSIRNQFKDNKDIQGQYAGAVNKYTTAQGQLSAAEKAYAASLGQYNSAQQGVNESAAAGQAALDKMNMQIQQATTLRDTNIGKAEAGRKGQLDAIRNDYLERLARSKQAYGNLANMTRVTDGNK